MRAMPQELDAIPQIQKRIDCWLNGPFDEETKAQVRSLREKDPQGLLDAFFCDLCFGTGGMRGLMGPGTNRINIYTIHLATQGLANYLRKVKPNGTLCVLIGFDNRHHSEEFAREAAKVLAGNKIPGLPLERAPPNALYLLCLPFQRGGCGDHDHSFPQPQRIQWLQSLLERWGASGGPP